MKIKAKKFVAFFSAAMLQLRFAMHFCICSGKDDAICI